MPYLYKGAYLITSARFTATCRSLLAVKKALETSIFYSE